MDYTSVLSLLNHYLENEQVSLYVLLIHYVPDIVDYFSIPPRVQKIIETLYCKTFELKPFGLSETFMFGKLHGLHDNYAKKNLYGCWWYKCDLVHRDRNLPAIKTSIRTSWFRHGKLHRDNDLPAIDEEYLKKWYVDGKLHRDEGLPAVIDKLKNMQQWYVNGVLHRDGGLPAVEDNYIKEWVEHGKFIRCECLNMEKLFNINV